MGDRIRDRWWVASQTSTVFRDYMFSFCALKCHPRSVLMSADFDEDNPGPDIAD